jgi:AraC-like DNA-binding protein
LERRTTQQSSQLDALAHYGVEAHLNVDGHYSLPAHDHPHYELLYILRGARGVEVDGRPYTAHGGDLMLFRPNQRHREWACSEQISYMVLRFDPERLQDADIAMPTADLLPPVMRLPGRERFVDLLGRMLEEHRRPQEDSRALLGIYLVEFLVLLQRAVREAGIAADGDGDTGMQRIRRALALMQRSWNESLSLDELAAEAFMSPSHFAHVFKQVTGESPKSYQIRERLEQACRLLAETDQSAAEIALQLGYDTPSFFYRQFKSKMGLTTGEYRRRTRRATEK